MANVAARFSQLPNEILQGIISALDIPSPFEQAILDRPTCTYACAKSSRKKKWSVATEQAQSPSIDADASRSPTLYPLKQISLTNSLLRALTLPVLFKHSVLDPLILSDFLSFIHAKNLTLRIESIVAHVHGFYSHVHPAWWARLLNEVPVTRINIIAAPEIFAELAGISTHVSDAWAFDMRYQILQLNQSPEAARLEIDYDDLPNFLTARPWSSMLVSEGSSLRAYTTYEYFQRRTPSLMAELQRNNSVFGDTLFSNLVSFDFIAIFPFYNHVDAVLKSIRKMTKLRRLFIKLCPEPESTVLYDEIEAAGGHLDVNDPWNECETSWMLIAHTVVFLTAEGALQELHMDDVKIEGVRDMLEHKLNGRMQQWWTYDGERTGTWRRKSQAIASPPAAGTGIL